MSVQQDREIYYRRNYIALLLDGFFFSFSAGYFSHTTVLPVYVSNLTSNSIFIGLLAVLYFGLSNGAAIFSCVLGVNAKSPKWTSVWICLTERIGFILIFISTFALPGSRNTALLLFFFSFAIYAVSAGLASPVYGALVSETIHRNVSSFYGSYYLVGSLAGVLGAQPIRIVLEKFDFPQNYRWLFLLGLAVAQFSTLSLALGIREVREDHGKRLNFSMLPHELKKILRNNTAYRNFLVVRICAAMADMSIPFYIIRVKNLSGGTDAIVGIMTTSLLVADMVSSKVLGRIGDRLGPAVMARISVSAGVLACLLAVFLPSPLWGLLLFVLVSAATRGMNLATQVASIHYAERGMVPIYTAASGIMAAPFYALFALGGGFLSNRFSLISVFYVSLVLYVIALLISFFTERRRPFISP
ncbi:MAG: MFS transporter [Treponema sp.]|jgi:MFS family permease|nr:MFS transporter [Treponema sp.]